MNIIDLGIWIADRSYGIPDGYPVEAAIPADNAMWWRRVSDQVDWKMFSMTFNPDIQAYPKWTINPVNLPSGKLLITLIEIESGKWLTQGVFRDYTAVGMPTRTRILLVDDLDPTDPKPHKAFEYKILDEANQTFVDYVPNVSSIQRHQGLLALFIGAQITEEMIRTKINEEPDLVKRETTRIRFESQTWTRNSDFIKWGIQTFNLSETQVDQLYKLAQTF